MLASIAAWALLNTLVLHNHQLDPAPFFYMQSVLPVAAVLMTLLILATQRRADRLASHREKLILQLALVSEHRSAKLVALFEELRGDLPLVPNRHDAEAQEMTERVDAETLVDALREERQEELPSQ